MTSGETTAASGTGPGLSLGGANFPTMNDKYFRGLRETKVKTELPAFPFIPSSPMSSRRVRDTSSPLATHPYPGGMTRVRRARK